MSPQAPQERGHSGSPATGNGRGLRNLPGFTVAAVAFFVIVILGIGGMAVANWSQSAKVTVGITAGAAPTTAAPTPTVPPVVPTVPPVVPTVPPVAPTVPPVAPATQGNIVFSPVIAQRPADVSGVRCSTPGNSGNYTISWDANAVTGVSYLVTLSGSGESKTTTTNSVNFKLENSEAAYGLYTLRIQAMKGAAAGDPAEITLQHYRYSQSCYNLRKAQGKFAVRGTVTGAKDNVMNLSWDAVPGATSYKVSIKGRNSNYGTEFTTGSPAGTLTFPPPASLWDAYFGSYDLRIQPMMGDQAGEAVYKVIQYYLWGLQLY